MADSVRWEYIVQTVGGLRSPKDEDMLALLNGWGEEGWELVGMVSTPSSSAVKLVAKRPLSTAARRRRTMPGME